ncbi:MAG: hypothetical protein U0Q19_17585 [Kineosporiaceae bacterium]
MGGRSRRRGLLRRLPGRSGLRRTCRCCRWRRLWCRLWCRLPGRWLSGPAGRLLSGFSRRPSRRSTGAAGGFSAWDAAGLAGAFAA